MVSRQKFLPTVPLGIYIYWHLARLRSYQVPTWTSLEKVTIDLLVEGLQVLPDLPGTTLGLLDPRWDVNVFVDMLVLLGDTRCARS